MDQFKVTDGTLVENRYRLLSEKLVVNDDKRYSDGISIYPYPTLKHNTYVITITDHN